MAALNIAIDASRATVARRTGTETYALQLIRALIALETSHRFVLYFRDTPAPGLFPACSHVEQRVIPWPRIWTHLRFAAALWRSRPDVTFVPAHTLPLWFPGPAVVTVRGMRAAFGNRATGGHGVGFVLVKIVRNLTSRPWHSFEMEVREIMGRPSTFEDGLSFGQAMGDRRVFGSDRFVELRQTDEPLDSVVFSGATILPGEQVAVRVVVTDFSPNWQFYILQRRDAPLAGLVPTSEGAVR
mgnify:CR=1 FL=1